MDTQTFEVKKFLVQEFSRLAPNLTKLQIRVQHLYQFWDCKLVLPTYQVSISPKKNNLLQTLQQTNVI